ncbi:MAG: sigma-54-dependent Fis family transcriptional regulator [Oligoflexia bacterium]|nr:sigma-54-dependent Fis family transcriptional regulator [Oligoflexia bacterium]
MNSQNLNVLIVDDELELRKTVKSVLENSKTNINWSFEEAATGLAAIQHLKEKKFDLVLMDVRMPELDGLSALKKIKENDPSTFVVLMTAQANVSDAIEAIKEGAYDYLEKPVQPEKMLKLVDKALEAREMVATLAISGPIFDDDTETEFVGTSQQMKKIFELIFKLSKVETNVLIRGENGTGKELVARAIHLNSQQKNGPFVAVNCGAIPENLMESEFFGHEKGAFTGAVERKIGKFQAAANGTLFLDEIGELSAALQVKLLRVLQERKFTPVGSTREIKTNARIIAATNRNLEKAIEEGGFREDLFYRLNVMPIFLPPLRERKEDIPSLVDYFIKKFSKRHQRDISSIEPRALSALVNFTWPGNIRELENVIEHCFIMENSSQITFISLPENVKKMHSSAGVSISGVKSNPQTSTSALNYDIYKEQTEKEFIISALKANQGKINQTVARANIPKNTLLRKIKKYGIHPKDYGAHDTD